MHFQYLLEVFTLVMCFTTVLPLYSGSCWRSFSKTSIMTKWSNHNSTSARYTWLWDIFLQPWHKYELNHNGYCADVEILRCSHSVQQLFCNSCCGKPLHQQDNAETSIFYHDALEEWPVVYQSEVLNSSIHIQVSQ